MGPMLLVIVSLLSAPTSFPFPWGYTTPLGPGTPKDPSPCLADRLLSPCQSCPRWALRFSVDGPPPLLACPPPAPSRGVLPFFRLPVSVWKETPELLPAWGRKVCVTPWLCEPGLQVNSGSTGLRCIQQSESYSCLEMGESSQLVIVVSGWGRGWVLSPASSPALVLPSPSRPEAWPVSDGGAAHPSDLRIGSRACVQEREDLGSRNPVPSFSVPQP